MATHDADSSTACADCGTSGAHECPPPATWSIDGAAWVRGPWRVFSNGGTWVASRNGKPLRIKWYTCTYPSAAATMADCDLRETQERASQHARRRARSTR